MDSYELNKIAGALLASLLLILGVQNLASVFYATEEADPMAYPVEIAEEGGEADDGAEVVEHEGPSLAALLTGADPAKGEKVARKCAACHTFEEGGANKVGPNLYGIVGRQMASVSGFNYSDALSGMGGTWDFEALNAFLEKPKDYVPGTAMAFAGLRKENDRADIIVYMNSLGSNLPLPPVEPTE
ncbi:MAG: cytochrome c family protein [Parvibaculaceae bacterium]